MSSKFRKSLVASLIASSCVASGCWKRGELAKGLAHKSVASGSADLSASLVGSGLKFFEKKKGYLEMKAASFKSSIRPSFPDTLTFNVACDKGMAPRGWNTATDGYDLVGFYAFADDKGEIEACEPAKASRHVYWGFLHCRSSGAVFEIKSFFPRELGDVDSQLQEFRCD